MKDRIDTAIIGGLLLGVLWVLVYHAGHIAGVNEGLVSCERGAVSKVTEGRVTICQYTRESQYGKVLMKERVR